MTDNLEQTGQTEASEQPGQPEQAQSFILHTDGGSRGNPGPSGIGFVLERGSVEVACGGAFIGTTTNNVAEYEALIWGLENARALGAQSIKMIADSELMIKQVAGIYKVKNPGLKALAARVQALLSGFTSWTPEHVLRADNCEADALVNQALDARAEVGEPSVPYTPTSPGLFPAEDFTTGPSQASGAAQRASAGATYDLTVKEHFDAAHSLYGYPGPCRELHGHTWDIEVTVSGSQLDDIGIIYDFKSLKDDLRAVLADYDHHYLNEVKPFDELSPTAENLARIIYERLAKTVDPRVTVAEVAVWESPVARLAYRASGAR
ncbi:MAG: 6-carboxytetrahydropterin synthase QueD [Coriobacteriia bacterium]|nr:6-carboxytetrahydropterin synthase QueD [Coriobacteriia bacterium]